MTELDFLAGIGWPAAFAILGTVLTLVGGALAIYVNYLKAGGSVNGFKSRAHTPPVSQLPTAENIQIHDRISNVRDRIAVVEGDQKVIVTQLENLTKQVDDHDERDRDDLKTINKKLDKSMEIIVEVLKDDH